MNSTLVGVITCAKPRDVAFLTVCRETWFMDMPATMDVVTVDRTWLPEGMPDTYESLPNKTKALAQYAFAKGYRAVCKCDNDTYVRPKLLRVPEAEYAGRVRGPSFPPEIMPCKLCGRLIVEKHDNHDYQSVKNEADYTSGGIYWLTRRAIQIIAEATITQDHAEDRWAGNVLLGFGIRPMHLGGYYASTLRNKPPTEYLRNPATVAVMNIESPEQMRRVHQGIFDVRHPAGSRPDDFPVGSTMRRQMR